VYYLPTLVLRSLLFLFVLWLFAGGGLRAAAQDDGVQLKAILNSEATEWKISGNEYRLATEDGRPVLFSGPSAFLEGRTRHGAPVEYRCTFRLRLNPGLNSLVIFSVANDKLPDGTAQSLGFSVSSTAGQAYLSYGRSVQPAMGQAVSGYFYAQPFTDRSLAWPDAMRRTLEAQMASAPKIEDLEWTLRYVLADGKFTVYLNERFVDQVKLADGFRPEGTMRLQLYNGIELLSISAAPLTTTAGARFEPLGLGGFFNAATLAGQRVTDKTFPAEGTVMLDGTAFHFSAPDARGNDHLDLSPSWTRFGAMPGYIMANSGLFGGRWTSAAKMDPSRFATYAPIGQYRALHLIAAHDGGKDRVPIVTAQFYRTDAGHPINFAGRVPAYTSRFGGARAYPIKLANGQSGNLFHVIIPLEPDSFAWFTDRSRLGLELTKAVQPYRAYPDPLEYSWHGAGLPSGVQIYAATLERAKVTVDPQPDAIRQVWTAPETPSYTIKMSNHTGTATTATLTIATASYDGKEKTTQQRTVALPANDATVPVKVTLHPTRYGLHYVTITCAAAGDTFTYNRKLAYLHPDTRERGDWAEGKGPLFGYFGWGGGHETPDQLADITVFGKAGAETSLTSYGTSKDPEVRALAEKYHIISEEAFSASMMYYNAFLSPPELVKKYNPADPEGTGKALIEAMREYKYPAGPVTFPTYLPFFPEPLLAERLIAGVFPHHYNGGEYQYTEADDRYYKPLETKFLIGARAVRKEWPEVKILFPYGDPMNTAVLLERCPEARELLDGIAVDMPSFERLPEGQPDQVSIGRMALIMQDVKKYIKNPYLVMIEGPCITSKDVDTTEEEKANIGIRNILAFVGHGVNRLPSTNSSCEAAGYWGENHYGGGYFSRQPVNNPEVAYTAYATMTRQLNRANFTKYLPTGSTSTYCQQFKHYKTGKLIHVLWTIRGQRPVTVTVPAGEQVTVYDQNDNKMLLAVKGDTVTFTIDQAPCYLEGLSADARITLGEPDHVDAQPAKFVKKLGNLGSGWTLTGERDMQYEDTNRLHIERFPGNMSARAAAAPKAQGGKALAVHLGAQEIDRRVMPYYTTVVPKSPIVIPGKASHLGIWVRAASDWGRVIYSLRDAKGEKWISVGTKDEWNCNDIRGWSSFCFDGWRYLRFQLPSSAPYDSFRERGTSWWGSYDGDGIVDLPLKLEKIIVERRSSVVYGNEVVAARPDDVLLGDLFAEYASPADMTREAVRLSRLRMPAPAGTPALGNPIAEMAKTGEAASTKVTKVEEPMHGSNGTRGHVFFTPVEGAKSYDVWVSPYPDGRGAVKLGSGWAEPGKLIEGLCADTEFYVFVVYTDRDGKLSKPSAPLKIHLKNRFGYQ
jgi:hypothetical protein